MMIERIINPETNEVIERPYTAKEIAEVEKSIAEAAAYQAEQDAKAAAKESAKAKLAALGLTEVEILALVGEV